MKFLAKLYFFASKSLLLKFKIDLERAFTFAQEKKVQQNNC